MDIDSCDKMSIDPAQKNRILWLDMANVLAMVCVVWFHIPSQLEMPIRGWEYICVNIPFFLLSGYSYAIGRKQDETFKSHLLTTLRTLYLPTIIFFTCFYLLWIAIGKTDFLKNGNDAFLKYMDEHNYPYEYRETEGGHIWRNWRTYFIEFSQKVFK